MAHSCSIKQARSILGDDFIGPDELRATLGAVDGIDTRASTVPFLAADLERARENSELLVLRA